MSMHEVHEKATKIVHEMVQNGFKLVDETEEEFATRYSDDIGFLNEMLENVKKWRKN